jgi:hypothetical protein
MSLRMAVGAGSPLQSMAAEDAAPVLLNVPYISQRPFRYLCWAACCEMVLNFYGDETHPLCALCTRAIGGAYDCCAQMNPAQCDKGHWPQDIYVAAGMDCSPVAGPLTPPSIAQEIDRGRPVEPFYRWNTGAIHTALICGYYPDGNLEPTHGAAASST